MGTQAHTLLALPVPLCSSCCSLLKCIYCTAYGEMKCLSAWSSGLSAILNRSLGRLRSAAPFLCSSLSSWRFPLRFGQGLAPALWNSLSFKWSWWGVKKQKEGGAEEASAHPWVVLACQSGLWEELVDSNTFWVICSALGKKQQSAVCAIPPAEELVVLQESQQPPLAYRWYRCCVGT